jgi:hypothetical protein
VDSDDCTEFRNQKGIDPMPLWNEFKGTEAMPKDRRLLLITQPSGTPDGREMDIHDVVVGHWSSQHAGFVQAIAPPERSPGSKLRVVRWAELTTPPAVRFRKLDGLL